MRGAQGSHPLHAAKPETLDGGGLPSPARTQECNTSGEIGQDGEAEDWMPRAHEPGATDFPTQSVVLLVICMALTGYTLTNLFPYVGMMVKDLLELQTTNEAGYYAGYVASAYSLGRFVSGYFWGRVSDTIGRKPVIIMGLLATAVFSTAFGLSTSFTMATSSRFLLGLMNGMVPALRTTMREICGPEHVVRGMNYLSGSKAISLLLGTGIGGMLAMPAYHYPEWFSATGFFGRYPFLLPNIVAACSALLLLPFVVVLLPETKDFHNQGAQLEPARRTDDLAVGPKDGADAVNVNYPGTKSDFDKTLALDTQHPGLLGPNGLLAIPNVKVLLFMACVFQFLLIGFDEVYPLWAVSTVVAGGLGWGTMEIGQVLLTAGMAMIICQYIVFPPVLKILGISRWQRLGGLLSVPAFLFVPYAKVFSWNATSLFIVSVLGSTLVNVSILANTLALSIASTSIVPPNLRGTLGGLYSTVENLGRCIGPAGFATTYAWSISPSSYHWVDYPFVFLSSAALSGAITVLAWRTFTLETLTQPVQNQRPVCDNITAATATSSPDQGALLLVESHKEPISPMPGGDVGNA